MLETFPSQALFGGILIGFSAVLLLAFNGRTAGISGILYNLLYNPLSGTERNWRLCFMAGLVGGAYFMLPVEDLSPWHLGQLPRFRQREVNTYDYLLEHAEAFAAAGVSFHGAEATAVESGAISLEDYRFVDWALGEESTTDESLSDGEQIKLASWLADGESRVLWINGSEILWDLGAKGSPSDVDFMLTWLGVDYGVMFEVIGI